MNFSSAQDERGYNQIFNPYGSTLFRAERRYRWFLEHVKNSNPRHIVELGCGTGEAAAYIASRTKAHVTAIDISEKFLNLARERYRLPNLEFVKFDIAQDDMSQFEKIDFIFGNGVLHHLVPVLDRVLIDMANAMRTHGQMAFIEPNYLNPYCRFIFGTRIGRRVAKLEPQEKAFTPLEIQNVLSAAGWHDINIKTQDFLIPGVPNFLIKPVLAIEPLFEAHSYLSWLAQSHFFTARI